ncbi:MAG: L-threonylcarbamoyladenylate synthase [Spirochaetia bacterium]|nr:L-threonylcarbamoyladenylate synthase [Spirochaetia bacterium]
MIIKLKKLKENQSDVTDAVSQVLLNDGIVIIPTDTIYGFSCLAGPAEKRLELIKGRDAGKHFLRLVTPAMVQEITDCMIPEKLLSCWPGPLTLIVPGRNDLTEGIRCPDNAFLMELLEKTGCPVDSTSVNYSGCPPVTDIAEIISAFGDKVDLIVDAGDLPPSLPSTIVNICGPVPEIVRQGQLKVEL